MATMKSTRSESGGTAKLEKEIAGLRKDLEALAKKCAALEKKVGESAGGTTDTSKLVSKHEFNIFKGKVSKKVGLKR